MYSSINQDQVTSAIRWVLTTVSGFVAGYLVSHGYQSAASAAALSTFVVGAAPGLAALIWSMYFHAGDTKATLKLSQIPAGAESLTAGSKQAA